MTAKVLVTGYGGFLGAAICRELLAHSYRVRGIARSNYPAMASLGVECVQGSVADRDVCFNAVSGVDAIIHTAAKAGVWGPPREYEIANIVATDNLLEAARKHHVGVFVFTSSPSVTFDGSPQVNVNESAPYPTTWLCDYPRTKAIAEQRVLAANEFDRFSTCALRPHLIWGVGDPHLIPRVIERCRSGRLRRVGPGTNLIDTVHVDNAALAHRLALEKLLERDRTAAGRAYFVTDGEPIACWDWISFLVRAANMTPPRSSLSHRTAYRLGAVLELLYRALRRQSEPPMTRFVASQLGVDHYFDISAARQHLGYLPAVDREQKLAKLKSWIAQHCS